MDKERLQSSEAELPKGVQKRLKPQGSNALELIERERIAALSKIVRARFPNVKNENEAHAVAKSLRTVSTPSGVLHICKINGVELEIHREMVEGRYQFNGTIREAGRKKQTLPEDGPSRVVIEGLFKSIENAADEIRWQNSRSEDAVRNLLIRRGVLNDSKALLYRTTAPRNEN